jgi:phosphoribosylglycinamide formyltransferase-1
MTGIAIFASGAGSNAKKIIEYFKDHVSIRVTLIVCNNPGAGVLNYAKEYKIPWILIDKEEFFRGNSYINELKQAKIDFIVLAGFLWKVPELLVNAYAGRIINIHPALLPKYGGKGMYGAKVHEAVIAAGEIESGITIHVIDGEYDRGEIIFQASCPVKSGDTADALALRIHELEHRHFARVIEEYIQNLSMR